MKSNEIFYSQTAFKTVPVIKLFFKTVKSA